MTLVTMSRKEFSRIKILQDVSAGSLSIDEAAALLRVTRRQLFRIQRAFRYRGAAALVSRRRGQPGNRRFPVHLRQETLAIIRERYVDFGPTLAAEKLAACHGLSLSRETLRQWMMAEVRAIIKLYKGDLVLQVLLDKLKERDARGSNKPPEGAQDAGK